jgi:hypothetical protein
MGISVAEMVLIMIIMRDDGGVHTHLQVDGREDSARRAVLRPCHTRPSHGGAADTNNSTVARLAFAGMNGGHSAGGSLSWLGSPARDRPAFLSPGHACATTRAILNFVTRTGVA